VTGSEKLFGSGREIADELRRIVKRELDLTISVGVSFNKVFAKLGSDLEKPDATTEITRENYREKVWPLPVGALLFVGKSAQEALAARGIRTIGDLAAADSKLITGVLGKLGMQIHSYATGEEDSPVRLFTEADDMKSVGNGMTFSRNITGEQDIRAGVLALADSVAARLRSSGMMCSTVQVQIKDPSMKTISRQKALRNPTQLAREISEAVMELIAASWSFKSPIRLLTITGTNLISQDEAAEQIDLFESDAHERRVRAEKLESAMDQIRSKFGKDAISFGSTVGKDIFGTHESED
jgi:DNA polymerase-4